MSGDAINEPAAWQGLIRRYAEHLPVDDSTPVVSLLEGNTPLIRADRLVRRGSRDGLARKGWLGRAGEQQEAGEGDREAFHDFPPQTAQQPQPSAPQKVWTSAAGTLTPSAAAWSCPWTAQPCEQPQALASLALASGDRW